MEIRLCSNTYLTVGECTYEEGSFLMVMFGHSDGGPRLELDSADYFVVGDG
jgi:hypothetical protein